MRRTIWLASYPKSGNTWFRMLIANLRRSEPVDINDLPESSGIASQRAWFDHVLLFPSGLLTHEECDRMRPLVYEAIARGLAEEVDDAVETAIAGTRFVKTHDGYTRTPDGTPLLGGRKAADGAILIVRDPRDVAPSLASHNRSTIDDAIGFMADPAASFCGVRDRQPNQLRQQLPGWGGFAEGWLGQADLPVHLVRYEDLHADTVDVLRSALAFAGIEVSAEEAAQAARFADFGELQKQEQARGFREAPRPRPGNAGARFFRRGVSGGWRDELDEKQVARIERDHAGVMARLGYAPSNEEIERMAG